MDSCVMLPGLHFAEKIQELHVTGWVYFPDVCQNLSELESRVSIGDIFWFISEPSLGPVDIASMSKTLASG